MELTALLAPPFGFSDFDFFACRINRCGIYSTLPFATRRQTSPASAGDLQNNSARFFLKGKFPGINPMKFTGNRCSFYIKTITASLYD